MAITRQKKEAIVTTLKDVIGKAKTIVFVNFDRVQSEEANALRVACADENVGYMVAKKTLIKRAFDDAGIDGDFPTLDGEIAVAYGDDIIAPARVIHEQGKKLSDNRLQIVGGVFEGIFVSQEYMRDISEIPPVKTLYAMFLNVIRAPVTRCAVAFGQIAEKKPN